MKKKIEPSEVTIGFVPALKGSAHDDFVRIYEGVLPADEREPTTQLVASINEGRARLIAAMHGEQLLGFAVLVDLAGDAKGIVYLPYLGVDPEAQGLSLGSKLVAQCKVGTHLGVVLEIEDPKAEDAPNAQQRASRLKFYENNGAVHVTGAPKYAAPDTTRPHETVTMWLLWLPGTVEQLEGGLLVACVRTLLVQFYNLSADDPVVRRNLETLATAKL